MRSLPALRSVSVRMPSRILRLFGCAFKVRSERSNGGQAGDDHVLHATSDSTITIKHFPTTSVTILEKFLPTLKIDKYERTDWESTSSASSLKISRNNLTVHRDAKTRLHHFHFLSLLLRIDSLHLCLMIALVRFDVGCLAGNQVIGKRRNTQRREQLLRAPGMVFHRSRE